MIDDYNKLWLLKNFDGSELIVQKFGVIVL